MSSFTALRRTATSGIALCAAALLLSCAAQQRPASAADANAPQGRADQLQTRTPDQISAEPSLAAKPLQPVPVPLDSAVAGSPSPQR
jgi:hypothetical protein